MTRALQFGFAATWGKKQLILETAQSLAIYTSKPAYVCMRLWKYPRNYKPRLQETQRSCDLRLSMSLSLRGC
jgi:hypothetical protein